MDGQPAGILGGSLQPFADPARTAEIQTPWATYPDLLDGECKSDGQFTYLALTVNGDPADPASTTSRAIPGGWGLHVMDANIAMGDIESLVASQAAAYPG